MSSSLEAATSRNNRQAQMQLYHERLKEMSERRSILKAALLGTKRNLEANIWFYSNSSYFLLGRDEATGALLNELDHVEAELRNLCVQIHSALG